MAKTLNYVAGTGISLTPQTLTSDSAQITIGLSGESYTTDEKNKLAGLESSHYKGTFLTLAALQAAFPEGEVPNDGANVAGDYADVDAVGGDVTRYVWDSNEYKWVDMKGVSASVTASEVKQLYESNSDTNAFTDSEKTKLSDIVAWKTIKVDSSSVDAGGISEILEFVAGTNITLNLNTTEKKLTITGPTIPDDSVTDIQIGGVSVFGA